MIALIDYGMGNIHSVKKALEVCGAEVLVTDNPQDIIASEKIVLPGVGAFDDAVCRLEEKGLDSTIRDETSKGKPFLGICLGMQLLFEKSEEAKLKRGLGIIRGVVSRFKAGELKVPHMGWNQIKGKFKDRSLLLKDVPEGAYVYFCHSYYPCPLSQDVVAGVTDYGVDFASVVNQGNVFGVQFHPEKSQEVGLKIMNNFFKLC